MLGPVESMTKSKATVTLDKDESSCTTAEKDEKDIRKSNVEVSDTKPFLITRLLRFLLPKGFLAKSENTAIASSKEPSRIAALLDYFFFVSAYRLVWTSALGKISEIEQFPLLSQKRHAAHRIQQFDTAFACFRGLAPKKNGKYRTSRHPFLRALLHTLRAQIIEGCLSSVLWAGVAIGHILMYRVLIRYLIAFYLADGSFERHTYGRGALYVLASATMAFVASFFQTRALQALSLAGGEAQTLVSAIVINKSLVISPLARREHAQRQTTLERLPEDLSAADGGRDEDCSRWSEGTVLNLLNTDAERVKLGFGESLFALVSLCAMPMVVGLSYWLIGWAGLASFALAIPCIGGIVLLVRSLVRVRTQINAATDLRVTKVNDLLHGIRLLKAYVWEDIYADLVRDIRNRESRLNQSRLVRGSGVTVLSKYMSTGPAFVALAILASKNKLGIQSSPDILTLALMAWLISMLMQRLPSGLVFMTDAWLSVKRIEDYLSAREFPVAKDVSLSSDTESTKGHDALKPELAICLEDAEFAWKSSNAIQSTDVEKDAKLSEKCDHFQLHPVTLDITQGELVAIVGATSSGKSSLAAGLACCMPLIRGTIKRQALPIYSPAAIWIRSTTIRENVLFYLPYDESRYQRVLVACSLDVDLARLGQGDQEVIGEKGITLSGGQKARIGLARAMYSALHASEVASVDEETQKKKKKNAFTAVEVQPREIVILDDPLSALDAKVGAAVFDKVILQGMTGMTRVLVTQQTRILNQCERVLWIENGKICADGTFEQLMERVDAFRTFVGQYKQLEQLERQEADVLVDSPIEASHDEGRRAELMLAEEQKREKVPWSLYKAYIRLPRSAWFCILILPCYCASQIANVAISLFFAWWTGQKYHLKLEEWIGLGVSLMFMHGLLFMSTSIFTQTALTRCSRDAGSRALAGVLRAPISFFDTTPLGRIIHRFTLVSDAWCSP